MTAIAIATTPAANAVAGRPPRARRQIVAAELVIVCRTVAAPDRLQLLREAGEQRAIARRC